MIYPVRPLLSFTFVLALMVALFAHPSVPAQAFSHQSAVTGTLSVVIQFEPSSLDPAIDYDTGCSGYIAEVYDRLVDAVGSRNVKIVPSLATSWHESGDGKTWTFHLRPHVKFHDGSPVDAKAVKFSFDRMLKAKQGAYADYSEIKSVTVVNPLTVQFHLQYPFAAFLPSLTDTCGVDIVSPKTAGPHPINPNGTSWLNTHEAGSGPYTLQTYQRRQKIVLTAFPGYWRGWSGRHVKTVVITWPSSSSTQRLELQRGDIDATMNLTAQDFDAVAHTSGIHVFNQTAQTIRDIRIDTQKGALKNQLVRQALNDAFDYNGVVQGVYRGYATRMRGVGPVGFKNFVPEPHLYTFDLATAKQLLKKSGVPANQLSFTIAYLPDDTQAVQMAQIFQADLKQIGVKTSLQGIPIATYVNLVKSPKTDPDIWIGSWTMDYADDSQMYWSYYYSKNLPAVGGGDSMFYKDPTTDKLMVSAMRATTASKARALFTEVCHRVYKAAPNIWTVQPDERIAVSSAVGGYQYNYQYGENYYPLYNMYRTK